MSQKPEPPTEDEYRAAKISMALDRVHIKPCRNCRWPVLVGYCCTACGSTDP
jgi:predicted RNA-binding protein with PUA domain